MQVQEYKMEIKTVTKVKKNPLAAGKGENASKNTDKFIKHDPKYKIFVHCL